MDAVQVKRLFVVSSLHDEILHDEILHDEIIAR